MGDSQEKLNSIVKTHQLSPAKGEIILQQFKDYFEIAANWERKIQELIVTDETQIAEMKMAREGRLFLRDKRLAIEKTRKELKEESLREGKAIDGIANVLKALIVPLEEKLHEQETFIERKETARKLIVETERRRLLAPYNIDSSLYDLQNMPENNFIQLLKGLELALKAEEEERLAEIERQKIEAEEREQRRKEMEEARIKAEQEAQKLRAEKAELEKQRDVAEKARIAAEKAKEKARLDAEKAKEKAVDKARESVLREIALDEKKKLAMENKMSDKEKLYTYIGRVNAAAPPTLKSKEAIEIMDEFFGKIKPIFAWFNDKINTLN